MQRLGKLAERAEHLLPNLGNLRRDVVVLGHETRRAGALRTRLNRLDPILKLFNLKTAPLDLNRVLLHAGLQLRQRVGVERAATLLTAREGQVALQLGVTPLQVNE